MSLWIAGRFRRAMDKAMDSGISMHAAHSLTHSPFYTSITWGRLPTSPTATTAIPPIPSTTSDINEVKALKALSAREI